MLHQQAACFCMSLSCIYRHIHDDGRAYTMVAAAQVAWICFAGILVAFAWATIRGAAWQQKRLESSASNGSSCMGCDAGGSTAGGRDTGCGAGGARVMRGCDTAVAIRGAARVVPPVGSRYNRVWHARFHWWGSMRGAAREVPLRVSLHSVRRGRFHR